MKKVFLDQMGRTVSLDNYPRRIVSVVPSQTELLFDLGLRDEVIGITKFCVHPEEWYSSKKRIGGTKQLNIEAIRSLQPDLIIGNKEENSEKDILELEKIAPVWMSDIYSVDDALNMITEIGMIVNREEESNIFAEKIKDGFASLREKDIQRTFLYFIWKDPDYLAGTETFIHAVLESAGFVNHCRDSRYPEWKPNYGEPDVVFLSSEPYPFKEEHFDQFKQRFPGSEILLVDGEMCSWYGTRMLKSIDYLKGLQQSLKRIS
jgi:ABC-type Fe3+-hydroxamate transport system substrate-binding protein